MPIVLKLPSAQPGSVIAKRLGIGLFCIGLILTLGWGQGARASYWEAIADEDFQFLPAYCKLAVRRYNYSARWGGLTPDQMSQLQGFEKRMGCAGDFHHYCAGLWHLHTTALPNPWLPRDHLLREAVGEFQYTLRGCERADAPMKPEILTNQARAYIGLKDYKSAVKVLTEAIRRNPKYIDAYTELSGVFLKVSSPDDARRTLEDGLKQVPDSRILKNRLERLSSKAGTDQPPADTSTTDQSGDDKAKTRTPKNAAPKAPQGR